METPYKSKFQEDEGPKHNDFRITFASTGDSSVGIPSSGDEVFVVFRYGDWPEDIIKGIQEDLIEWFRGYGEGKFEYKISPLVNNELESVISKIPEQRLPSQEYED